MLGLPRQTVLPAAIALEMIHCFTLIHDDLPCMDNDDFRRGLPTNHRKFGEATALLAGDALLALAAEMILETPLPPQIILAGLKHLLDATGPRGVIGGQASEALLKTDSSLEDLSRMHALKTGALFLVALKIPKEFAKIEDSTAQGKSILKFGQELGLAFQIADDLEDLQSQDTKPIEVTSILHYLTPREAQQRTYKNLAHATDLLEAEWGSQAQPLVQIAKEVLEKLTHALPEQP